MQFPSRFALGISSLRSSTCSPAVLQSLSSGTEHRAQGTEQVEAKVKVKDVLIEQSAWQVKTKVEPFIKTHPLPPAEAGQALQGGKLV